MDNPNSVLDLIGNTPMLKTQNLDTGKCELFLKLECQNPGGSIKDRIALSMINDAEKNGYLKPGDTIVEATAGNTGLGLALVASAKGYKLKLVVPDKMSKEKIFHLKAMGAEVIITRSDVIKGHKDYYQDLAQRIAKDNKGFYINQFCNKANPLAHFETTGPEILNQMQNNVDAIVCGVGSGGTITGLSNFFKIHSDKTEMILADPKGSILVDYIKTGKYGKAGSWIVEGIGEDFVPEIADFTNVKKGYTISDEDSCITAREVLLKEGVLAGSSSGTLINAALQYCKEQTSPKRVVTFVCDSGNKYLSKVFNDFWLLNQGILKYEKSGNLKEIISRKFEKKDIIFCNSTESVESAINKMSINDISQLPIIDNDELVGLVDEWDILKNYKEDSYLKNTPISKIMTKKLRSIDVNSSIDELVEILENSMVAVIEEKKKFVGLVTKIDLISYIKNKRGENRNWKILETN